MTNDEIRIRHSGFVIDSSFWFRHSSFGKKMKPLTIQQIRQAVGGKALTPIPATAPLVTAVCTDTRRMESGCLFVAINGENFNAHNFLPDAAKGGAVAAIVQEMPERKLPNLHLIEVKDSRTA